MMMLLAVPTEEHGKEEMEPVAQDEGVIYGAPMLPQTKGHKKYRGEPHTSQRRVAW